MLVPIQCEYYALEGLAQLLDSIERVRASLNPRLSLAGMLLTMADGRTRLSADVAAEVRRAFRRPRLRGGRAAERAPGRGAEPRPSHHRVRPGSAGADAYYRVASELVDRVRANPRSRRRGLGRGLEVLMGGAPPRPSSRSFPSARSSRTGASRARVSTSEAIAALAESMRVQGVIQPVVVRPLGAGRYELIAGERRWRAAVRAGLATVPALVRETDDRESLLLALVENVAREDLSAVEEARAYAALQDEFGLSLGEVAERVGRSKPSVSNRLRLLELPDDVLRLVEGGRLSEGHARAVLAVPGNEERRRLAQRIVRQGLSVRAAERAARWAGARTKPRRSAPVDPELAARARAALERLTGAAVKVGPRRLEVAFADETELAEIVESLEPPGVTVRAAAPLPRCRAADSDRPPGIARDAAGERGDEGRRRAPRAARPAGQARRLRGARRRGRAARPRDEAVGARPRRRRGLAPRSRDLFRAPAPPKLTLARLGRPGD